MTSPRRILHGLWTLALLLALRTTLPAQTFDPHYLDGHLYLKLADTTTVELDPYANNIPALNLILATFGVDSLYRPFHSGHPALAHIYRMEFSSIAATATLIAQLELLPFVDYAEKVPLVTTVGDAVFIPTDLQASQWSLTKIQAPLAWDVSVGNPAVTVAIVDNAVRITHEDLAGVIWTNPIDQPNNLLDEDLNGYTDDQHGYDVADMDPNTNPPAGMTGWDHGTHCAGIAGAETDNGVGVASIGFGISIIPVKCSNDAAGGNTLSRAYEGVDYARAAGADIISMSWGSLGASVTGDLILSLANNAGILLVAAAGNNGDSIPFYPAANALCLAVGSTDQNDVRSPFSNYGDYVDVMAPGSDIFSCFADSSNAYGTQSGTSMAAPLVAGLAGLTLSLNPAFTAADLRAAIVNGCVNIDAQNPGMQGKIGAGRVNAFNCLVPVGTADAAPPRGGWQPYPNPASGTVHLPLPEGWSAQAALVEAYDLQGRLLATQAFSGSECRWDCSGWAAGTYCLRLRDGQHAVSALLQVR